MPREGVIQTAWEHCKGEDSLAVEFGLEHEFMLPLATGKLDPFVGIIGALSELGQGELGLFQILFQATHHPWGESINHSVSDFENRPFFVNRPELAGAAKQKTSSQIYAAVVRIALRSNDEDRTLQIARDIASTLRIFSDPNGNALIPLSNED